MHTHVVEIHISAQNEQNNLCEIQGNKHLSTTSLNVMTTSELHQQQAQKE